ncbi:MAG TPA: NAD(P)H-dependent glycerol-3-phosphate dehydrogenase, partial [Longimicrobium sp.]
GLAGMGDLILTCTGGLSRNRHVGMKLGEGQTLKAILADMKMVAEGVETSRAAHDLALREGIEMPIVTEVYRVMFEDKPARDAVRALMVREPKPEQWQ